MKVDGADDPSRRRSRRLNLKALRIPHIDKHHIIFSPKQNTPIGEHCNIFIHTNSTSLIR
jgi:hypothetical protein